VNGHRGDLSFAYNNPVHGYLKNTGRAPQGDQGETALAADLRIATPNTLYQGDDADISRARGEGKLIGGEWGGGLELTESL